MAQSNVTHVAVVSGTADVDVITTQCMLYGWWFQESAGTPATAELLIRDGAGGAIIARLEFTSNENKVPMLFPWPQGLRMNKGITVDRVSGETQGTIFYGGG